MARPKKSKKMPVMFYQTITKEDLEKKQQPPKSNANFQSHSQERTLWMYGGVITVMAMVLFSWIYFLPRQLKISDTGTSIEKELFSNSSSQLSALWEEQQQITQSIKKILTEEAKALVTSSTSTSASSTLTDDSVTLSQEQLEELKNKIEKK